MHTHMWGVGGWEDDIILAFSQPERLRREPQGQQQNNKTVNDAFRREDRHFCLNVWNPGASQPWRWCGAQFL